MSRVNYYEYLRSPEWQVVRRLALERAAGRCQVCNQPGRLDVHHRTYARLGQELLSDVTVLCRDCHSKHHEKLPPVEGLAAVPPIQTGPVDPDDGPPLASSNHDQAARIAEEVFGVQRSSLEAA